MEKPDRTKNNRTTDRRVSEITDPGRDNHGYEFLWGLINYEPYYEAIQIFVCDINIFTDCFILKFSEFKK